MKNLSPKQRSFLASLAREGFNRLASAGATDEPFNDWRRREAVAACGASISEAPAAAFDALHVHFLAMAGKVQRAFEAGIGEVPNDLRQVLFRVEQERRKLGVAPGYVAGIARRMFGREPETVPEAVAVLVALVKAGQRQRRAGE